MMRWIYSAILVSCLMAANEPLRADEGHGHDQDRTATTSRRPVADEPMEILTQDDINKITEALEQLNNVNHPQVSQQEATAPLRN